MKQTLLLLLLLIVCKTECKADKIRFTDTTNSWQVAYTWAGLPQDAFACVTLLKFGSDSVLNGRHYLVLYGRPNYIPLNGSSGGSCDGTGGYFREDTVQGKVWYHSFDFADTAELLIYNHHWVLGDTIHFHGYGSSEGVSTVVQIDSTQLKGIWRRVFFMHSRLTVGNGFFTPDYAIIEGIGSTYGPSFPARPMTFEDSWELCAFYQSGVQSPINPVIRGFSNTGNCNALAVNAVTAMAKQMSVFPNPANGTSVFAFSGLINTSYLTVSDVLGRIVMQIETSGKHEIPVSQYVSAPGVYTYTLQDVATGKRYTGRFLFQ